MNVVLEKLNDWDCDVKGALERFLDDEQMYMDFLKEVSEDENLNKLKVNIEDGNVQSAFEAAHTLKGVYGNMGLTPLYKMSIDMVETLRGGSLDGMQDKCQELIGKNEEFKGLLK